MRVLSPKHYFVCTDVDAYILLVQVQGTKAAKVVFFQTFSNISVLERKFSEQFKIGLDVFRREFFILVVIDTIGLKTEVVFFNMKYRKFSSLFFMF